ncbi:hypothetical protein QJS04_geneDACA008880 [Acorus gramineus]|uniref:FAS1 domain-containing protein n=1 Tax=Acorus gramineus TaxID=55184 RepID=A0AAV9AB03_ACOGR|nr:hypothetical protein QJS04_geneDACA008880 [Acorus gramineus]
MQTANYFTFVTLINMVRDYIPGNTTFLMPNDRTLSKVSVPPNEVSEFLSRHSIPSPLLFDHLQHFPTGSIIPTHKPDYLLRISNGGRKSFYLNNVRLTSRNICVRGSSFRCHGINDVLTVTGDNTIATSSNCSSASARPSPAPASPPLPSSGPEEDHLVRIAYASLNDLYFSSQCNSNINVVAAEALVPKHHSNHLHRVED